MLATLIIEHPGALDGVQTSVYGPLQGSTVREVSLTQERRQPLNPSAVPGKSKAASLLPAGLTFQSILYIA